MKVCTCREQLSYRVPPWTVDLVADWPDGRIVIRPECRRGHPVPITAGDVHSAVRSAA